MNIIKHLFAIELQDKRQMWRFVARLTTVCVAMAAFLDLVCQLAVGSSTAEIVRNQVQTVCIASFVATPVIVWIATTNLKLIEAKAELYALSRTDVMTGLLNRRAFMEELSALRGREITIAIIDIDFFKKINDRFGHLIGDQVIGAVARQIQAAGGEGIVARVGGEEFVYLEPTSVENAVTARMEMLRTAVAEKPVMADGLSIKVTVSIGVARAAGREAAAVYGAADTALYAAKAGGRNRVMSESMLKSTPLGQEVDWLQDVVWNQPESAGRLSAAAAPQRASG